MKYNEEFKEEATKKQAESLTKYLDLIKKRPEEFVNVAGNGSLEIITDKNILTQYIEDNNTVLGVIYESRYHILLVDLVKDCNGRIFQYERLLKQTPGGSVIVPVYKGKFILLKQFRHSMRKETLCFPRGFQEPDLTPEANAANELREELGVEDFKLRFLGNVVADSGVCGNEVAIYYAELNEKPFFKRTEGITQLIEMDEEELGKSDISDGFTLSGIALYKAQIK